MNVPAFSSSPTTTLQPPTPPQQRTPSFHAQPNLESTVSWTSSISRYCRNGRLAEAVNEFTRMRLSGVEPNHATFISLLSCCAHFPSQSRPFGAAMHAYARKLSLDTQNVKVGTAVVDMYSKFGQVGLARLSFDHTSVRNRVTWNTMIDGYMRNGKFDDAVELFDEMPQRDAVSWTALIGGFVKNSRFQEALEWFQEMLLSGVEPDYVTMISALSACANLGTLSLGLWLHCYILQHKFNDNVRVNNTLIDMYCRCGCVELALQVFKRMPEKSIVSWNSIIVGLAANGHAEEALKNFNLMQKKGFKPDGVSYTGALTACSHAGLVKQGLNFFKMMVELHRISPRIEHYGCIVDLYSRAGRVEDALSMIKNMPMKPNEVILGSVMAACRSLGDVRLAEKLMNYISELDPGGDSNHVLLSNIYAALGSWRGASKVRRRMKELGIQKKPGISSIEVSGAISEFVAGDKSHEDTQFIYAMLDLLSQEIRVSGYVPDGDANQSYESW
ncbi:pentatricopeptide repeat-containing protein At1g05750, chloroplastic [Ipomoea triloba]|uniref:pentatricopeptide repeat-containing protein At1g05750, chloroplastic n=1 Tax=Ipomoea triloba TaxID=35885 RepID=UPI00125E9635|nr:pentatricopeptide repeat-containing protein At1g05750, chloroplastic [Ipomoea triloba]